MTSSVYSENRQCVDNARDRKVGEFWERAFCKMLLDYGQTVTPLQIGRRDSATAQFMHKGELNTLTLPDIVVWNYPGSFHEIKHKDPNRFGCYGLEEYRFDALIEFFNTTHQSVFYTIHDHSLSGGRHVKKNDMRHWRTVRIEHLIGTIDGSYPGNTWYNGQKVKRMIHYWNTELWSPLSVLFNN